MQNSPRSFLTFSTAHVPSITVILLLCSCLPAHGQSTRNLSGTVTDAQHEPLRGAVVQLENDASEQVTSYITDRAGHFQFKRLDGGSDYTFWATYRSARSKSKHLSMFDTNLSPSTNLTVKLR